MRFESVTAHAFGPFRGETLSLAPGVNVVYGPNEAGKSTWHAALYAGLCGIRRSRGQPRREDREFEERHRPWDDGSWGAGAVIQLEDGRRVQLRHDLAGRVDSSARDADFAGRDYSNEVMGSDGVDGARWLGLDRRSFLSTACVRQAAILRLLDDAASLQDELQRAADTAGADETAAEALQRLRDFHSEHVGSGRAWTKPLQSARDERARAQRVLEEARHSHAAYLERRATVEELEERVQALEREAAVVRAALAEAEAARTAQRLRRARELSERFPGGAPRRAADDDRLAQQVATALEVWRSRPEPTELRGSTVPELEAQLDGIDRQLGTAAHEPPVGAAHRRSAAWAVAGAAGMVAGGALAFAGLVLPGAVVAALGLALIVWWALTRPSARPAPDTGATRARLEEQRRHIEHLIDDRQADEQAYANTVRERDEAASAVQQAALSAGVGAGEPGAQVEGLIAWQARREEALAELDRESEDWEELQRLLGDFTLEQLAGDELRLRTEAETLTARVDATELAAVRARGATEQQLAEIGRQIVGAREQWNREHGQIEQLARDLPSVAEAEEALAAAERELARVECLDGTLRTTIEFLERAEERVHRDIAPVLRGTVLEWLPRVTGGRYTDCAVDPQTLSVEVAGPGGRWRRAELLSHGTAEQLYLLLRLALARHLTKPGEVCPLILDDAVAACDSERKREVLETLLALAESVQVILFTHEEDVRDWARERLSGPHDSLTELDPAGVPA